MHLPTIPRTFQLMPLSQRQTREKPTVAPTMLWVADTGSFRNVAPSSNIELPTVTIQLSQHMNHIICIPEQFNVHQQIHFLYDKFQYYCYAYTHSLSYLQNSVTHKMS